MFSVVNFALVFIILLRCCRIRTICLAKVRTEAFCPVCSNFEFNLDKNLKFDKLQTCEMNFWHLLLRVCEFPERVAFLVFQVVSILFLFLFEIYSLVFCCVWSNLKNWISKNLRFFCLIKWNIRKKLFIILLIALLGEWHQTRNTGIQHCDNRYLQVRVMFAVDGSTY